jgi:ATP synthase proteolipid subunit
LTRAARRRTLISHDLFYILNKKQQTKSVGNMESRHPGSVMKNVIPIVMAGVIGIYGLIIAVILGGNIPSPTVGTGENIYSIYTGMAHVS